MAASLNPSCRTGGDLRFGFDLSSRNQSMWGRSSVSGWCFDIMGRSIFGIRASIRGKTFTARRKQSRPWVAAHFPECIDPNLALFSGFTVDLDLPWGGSQILLEWKSEDGDWIPFATLEFSYSPITNAARSLVDYFRKIWKALGIRRPKRSWRVAILTCEATEFCHVSSLYRAFSRDPRFTPFVVPYSIRHPETGFSSDVEPFLKFLGGKGFRVLTGVAPPQIAEGVSCDDGFNEIDICVIFLPYIGLIDERLWESLRSKRLCYVPYGALINHVAFENPFYDSCWKILIDHQLIEQRFREAKGTSWTEQRCFVTGLPKLDAFGLPDGLPEPSYWPRPREAAVKRVLILDHWTLVWSDPDQGLSERKGYSQFLRYRELFLSLPGLYPQLDFVFRPHPLLFPNLVKRGLLSQSEVSHFRESFAAFSNAAIDDLQTDYILRFKESDCLIASGISCWTEYLPSKNPILMLEKDDGDDLNEYGKALTAHHYRARSAGDVHSFLKTVVIGGNDSQKVARLRAIQQFLVCPKGGSARAIAEYLGREIRRETANGGWRP